MSENRRTLSAYWIVIIVLAALTVVLNLAAFSSSFCDAYTDSVYGLVVDVGGRITDLFPVALGELIMYLSALALVAAVILMVILIFLRKSSRYRAAVKRYMKILLMYTCCMLFIYTVNWVIPYRGSLFGKSFETDVPCDEEHLRALREYLIERVNEEALAVQRDPSGSVIYPDDDTVRKEVAESMRALADEYPRLSGYYPRAKKALCSEVLDYMFIGGYTYPYTMEVTCNRYVDRQYYPTLFAHESAHHQGYYKENEANYLSFLACTTSTDPVLRYSGYLFAYFYVEDAYAGVLKRDDEKLLKRHESIRLSEQVAIDRVESIEAAIAEFEKYAGAFDFLKPAAEEAAEIGWDTQDEVIGDYGYDGVVPLLLEWFSGIG